MCYSTLIEADFKKLQLRFDAELDWESVETAFVLRETYSAARIPAGIDSYLIQSASNSREKKLAKMAKSYYQQEIEKLSKKKEKFENDCLAFEEKIRKGSKAKDLDVKLQKRQKSVQDLKKQIEHYSQIEDSGASRVFPNFYAPTIVSNPSGDRLIRLMRYHILPANGKELIPFRYNLFNARRDKLSSSRIWKKIFGKQHAIYPFFRFYESVDDGHGGSQSIYFESRDNELMWSASLFESSLIGEQKMLSHAAITDEPPSEIAATGHDRCPVFLAEGHIDNWLRPEGASVEELLELLENKTSTYYENHLAAA